MPVRRPLRVDEARSTCRSRRGSVASMNALSVHVLTGPASVVPFGRTSETANARAAGHRRLAHVRGDVLALVPAKVMRRVLPGLADHELRVLAREVGRRTGLVGERVGLELAEPPVVALRLDDERPRAVLVERDASRNAVAPQPSTRRRRAACGSGARATAGTRCSPGTWSRRPGPRSADRSRR